MPNPEAEPDTEIAEPIQHDVTIPFQREDEDDLEPTIVLGRE